jgi:hypothetical protein
VEKEQKSRRSLRLMTEEKAMVQGAGERSGEGESGCGRLKRCAVSGQKVWGAA